jgi:hypothetical protein
VLLRLHAHVVDERASVRDQPAHRAADVCRAIKPRHSLHLAAPVGGEDGRESIFSSLRMDDEMSSFDDARFSTYTCGVV